MPDDRFATGHAMRRSILGDAHVDRAQACQTAFDADFQRYITENAWGSVWSRPGLDTRMRSLLTIALLAGLGHWEEFAMHVRASQRTGATGDEIREALFQVAVYAGVPAANRAFAIAKEVLADLDRTTNEGSQG